MYFRRQAVSALQRGIPFFFVQACAALALTSPSTSAAAEARELTPAPLRSIQEFWDRPIADEHSPQPFRLECEVLYFDPEWRHLWIHDESGDAFVTFGDRVLPVQAGQRILATGTLHPPNVDLSFEDAAIAVLGPSRVAPVAVDNQIDASSRFINRLVTIEALVDRQTLSDLRHLRLFLSIGSRMVYAWVLMPAGEPVPQLTHSYVRVQGVYNPKLTPSGQLASVELMVRGPDAITVIGNLANDPRFAVPATPLAALPGAPADQLVRVVGQVKAQEPGRTLRLRDETGQIEVMAAQTRLCSINDPVEAVGYPVIHGTEWKLERAFFRPVKTTHATVDHEADTGPRPPLRVAAQVLELPPAEAARNHPVMLSGVVTWSHPDAPFFFLQDASGGVGVLRGDDPSVVRPAGRNVEVEGVTAMGDFAPVVQSIRVTKIGDIMLPESHYVSLEHALTGVEEAQWVEMRGYLREIRHDGVWTLLELATSAGDFTARLPATADLTGLRGAVVRLHGVCSARADEHRKLTGIQLWVPSTGFVQVEEAAPADLFDRPGQSLASLSQFGTLPSFPRRTKVAGTVLNHSPGQFVTIQEGDDALLVLSREIQPLTPGDQIECVGFVGRHEGRVALREAVYRRVGAGPQPTPRPLPEPARLVPNLHGHLVRVEGTLIDRSIGSDHVRLILQTEKCVFEAFLDSAVAPPPAAAWRKDSRLAVTGVYEIKADEYDQPVSFQVRLRTVADVEVLRLPSVFTPARILTGTGVLALLTLGIVAWVVGLRRQVRRQTEQLRQQVQREARLHEELQRATRLESLGVLAGGIAHDFNNLLTIVMGNLSLALLDTELAAESAKSLREAERAILRSRDLTQQLLTFAKGGAPVCTAILLPDIVREVTQFTLHGSTMRCEFAIAPDLWPANVDKGQISQVVQNIVLNAREAMAGGGTIRVRLSNEEIPANSPYILAPGRFVKLSVADEGPGITAENLTRIFDPYFTTKPHGSGLGLATVYSIVKRHHGHVAVDSPAGAGSTFHVWLPAVPNAAAAAPAVAEPVRPSRGRVLVMDDEEAIRRLTNALLPRLGFSVTTVCDGGEAVREYRSALSAGARYDLVVLDLTIPGGMGGCQTIAELRKIDPRVRAIVASGYSNDPVMANHRAYGFCGRVTKPFEITMLMQEIRAVLAREPA